LFILYGNNDYTQIHNNNNNNNNNKMIKLKEKERKSEFHQFRIFPDFVSFTENEIIIIIIIMMIIIFPTIAIFK